MMNPLAVLTASTHLQRPPVLWQCCRIRMICHSSSTRYSSSSGRPSVLRTISRPATHGYRSRTCCTGKLASGGVRVWLVGGACCGVCWPRAMEDEILAPAQAFAASSLAGAVADVVFPWPCPRGSATGHNSDHLLVPLATTPSSYCRWGIYSPIHVILLEFVLTLTHNTCCRNE
jgi:hypothetical protein